MHLPDIEPRRRPSVGPHGQFNLRPRRLAGLDAIVFAHTERPEAFTGASQGKLPLCRPYGSNGDSVPTREGAEKCSPLPGLA